jgi:cytochrome c553
MSTRIRTFTRLTLASLTLGSVLVVAPVLQAADESIAKASAKAKTAEDYNLDFRASDYEYCLTCHGSRGQGNPAIKAPVLAGMPAWSLNNQLEAFRFGWRGQHPDDVLGMEMYPMAAALTAQQTPEVIAYITALAPQHAPARLAGDAVAGEALYKPCAACHGAAAQGLESVQAPGLARQWDDYLVRQIRHFRDGVRGSADGDSRGAIMMAMAGHLSDDDIDDVVAYIKTLGAAAAEPQVNAE